MIVLVRACRNRLWLFGIGLVLTAVFTGFALKVEPVYFAQTDLVLLAPLSQQEPNVLADATDDLIATAGVLQRDFDGGNGLARTSSASVSLSDEGVYDGVQVRLPDTGGQWQHSFSRPVLDIQVTGSTPDDVARRMLATQLKIGEMLARLQDQANVRPRNRIRLQAAPASLSVERLIGSRVRAGVASSALGLGLTLGACMIMAVLSERRRPQLGMSDSIRPRAAAASR